MTNMIGSKLSIFSHLGKITGYWITTRSFPYRGPYCQGHKNHARVAPIITVAEFKWFILQVILKTPLKYIQINTWAFPYWPGYHPSPPFRANMGVPGQIWASIWKWSCSNPITGYFPGVWKYGQFSSGHIGHTKMPLFELIM
jgi:hypothetical protein